MDDEGIKDVPAGADKSAAAAVTTDEEAGEATKQSTTTTTTSAAGGMADVTFKGISDVLKLLPTATVIVYEVLNPIVTNTGDCSASIGYKVATAVLLGVSGFFCAFSTFTDSYVGADGRVRYGLVTPGGLLPFTPDSASGTMDLSRYKLAFGDLVHAAFAVAVFAAVALLADANTVACFYPALGEQQKQVVMALPVVVGAVASVVFVVFPSTRHGVGYGYPPPSSTETTTALVSQ